MMGDMGMEKLFDRDAVWAAIVRFNGDRKKVAAFLGVSMRTVERYLDHFNLRSDMDKHGYTHHRGPPRGQPGGTSYRQERIFKAIEKFEGKLNYKVVAEYMYGDSSEIAVQRVYNALYELKSAGKIAFAEGVWFIV